MKYLIIIFLLFSVNGKAQIIRAQPFYRPIATQFLLDAYPNAAVAYSLRKLKSSYSGNAIKVRRSSDNATQDIGFTSNGDLDTSSMKTFIGANSGFIDTWYSQGDTAKNMTMSTLTQQPRIINAGTIDRRNGDICLVFDGSNDYLTSTYGASSNISPTSFFVLSSRGNTSNANRSIFGTGILQTARGYGSYYSTGDSIYTQNRFQTTVPRFPNGIQTILNENGLFDGFITTTSTNVYLNGANNKSLIYTATNTTSSLNLGIGTRDATGSGTFLNGTISELIIYQSDQSSNRTGIESNINSFYSIY